MKIVFDKPKYGERCNGCGYCCSREVCALGKMALGEAAEAPCALMLERDGRYWCGLVEAEKGLGYWVGNYGFNDTLESDHELNLLLVAACEAMEKFEVALVKYGVDETCTEEE